MSTLPRRYFFKIELDPIEAPSEAEALKIAYKMLEYYAESNDGSEFLANSTPVYSHEEVL